MISKRIPEKYDYDQTALINAIESVLGSVPITIRGRVVTIDADLEPGQGLALKNAVLPTLTEVDDITL